MAQDSNRVASDHSAGDHSSGEIFDKLRNRQRARKEKSYALGEYLELCRKDSGAYMLIFGRLLKAFGAPMLVDTSKDPALGPIFNNRTIKRYPAFKDFFGGEKDGGYDIVTQIAEHLEDAEKGGAARKKILMLKGPVSGGKSTLAEIIKKLAEQEPFYVLRAKDGAMKGKLSPAKDSPLCLFDQAEDGAYMQKEFGIPPRYLRARPSSWVLERLEEYRQARAAEQGADPADIDVNPADVFDVVRVYPSQDSQYGISMVTAGTANNQDEGDFVGRIDINKLGQNDAYSESHPDVYNYQAGGLIRGHQGVVELIEILKLENPKALNCMLTATEEGMFSGVGGVGRFPSDSLILAHLNDDDYDKFKVNPTNVAFISRTNLVTVPYTLRASEEEKIFEKYLRESDYSGMPVAPGTLKLLAQFSVLTRLKPPPEGASTLVAKMRVYDGENLKSEDPRAKNLSEYRDHARGLGEPKEGMAGIDRRIIFDTLSATFNRNAEKTGEKTADPPQLIPALREMLTHSEKIRSEDRDRYIALVDGPVKDQYLRFIDREIRTAALEGADAYGQAKFDRYIEWAEAWLDESSYIDPETTDALSRDDLNRLMTDEIEKPAGISNNEKFRESVVRYVLQFRNRNNGANPDWKSYQKFRDVMEKIIFSKTDALEIASFGPKKTEKEKKDHQDFLERMMAGGRTEKMVRREVQWWQDNKIRLVM